jgi:uncharacterized damage-inducible protein DinB
VKPLSYRIGGLGAIMDEYQKAIDEYTGVIRLLSPEQFTKIVDPNTSDEHCRSIQTISKHVVRSGYGYANYVLSALKQTSAAPDTDKIGIGTPDQAIRETETMLSFNIKNLYDLHREQIELNLFSIRFMTRWDEEYDIEQLLEHAIVHILRHRRQIEKFSRS